MDPAIARLTLNDRGPLSVQALSFWQAVDVELPFAIFEHGSTTVLETSLSNIESVHCEVYKGRSGGGDLLMEATPILGSALNAALNITTWNNGSAQHGTFTFSDEQMNQYVPAGVLECWVVIYAVTTGNGRNNLGAGTFQIFRNRGLGAGLPPALYYTKAEVDALIAGLGSGGGTTNLTHSRAASTLTVISDTGSDTVLPAADASLAGVMSAADKVKLDALPTSAAIAASIAGKASVNHRHTFAEILDLPATTPRDVNALVLPLGVAGASLSHALSFSLAYHLMQVRPSAQNYVLALLLEGVTPTSAQLAAIDGFFGWSDAVGFVAGQSAGARLLLPVWNNAAANVINLLAPATLATKARLVNPSGFTTVAGSTRTDMAAVNKGFIALDTTSALAWATDDWAQAYYSHLGAQTGDNAAIGARNDALGSGNRYINTTTATIARWSPGYLSGAIDVSMDTSLPLGLMWIGYKGTKLDARQVKAAATATLLDVSGAYNALLTPVPFLGLAYNQEAGPTSLSGQPVSLLFVGKKVAADATASTDFATALYNLATGTGATPV